MGDELQQRYEKWINDTEIVQERQRAIRNANDSARSMTHLNRIDILKCNILLYLFEGGVIRFNDMQKEPERMLVEYEFNQIIDDMLWEKW